MRYNTGYFVMRNIFVRFSLCILLCTKFGNKNVADKKPSNTFIYSFCCHYPYSMNHTNNQIWETIIASGRGISVQSCDSLC